MRNVVILIGWEYEQNFEHKSIWNKWVYFLKPYYTIKAFHLSSTFLKFSKIFFFLFTPLQNTVFLYIL